MAVATDTVERIVLAALAEDIGAGDVTTDATVPADAVGVADLLVKEAGVVCGVRVAETTFRALDPDIRFEALASDGDVVEPPAVVARISGSERAILTGERVALNFLGRLSGIATLTRRYVDAIEGTGASVLDTRKTTPGLRELEKYAVACGGGRNHRFGLDDAVLDQGQPPSRRRLDVRGRGARARRRRRCRSRSSATRSTRSRRRSLSASTRSFSTT